MPVRSYSGNPVLAILSWMSHPGYLVLFFLFSLSQSACPLLVVLFWLSFQAIFDRLFCLGFHALAVLSWLSSPGCPLLAVLSWQPVLAVVSWQSCFDSQQARTITKFLFARLEKSKLYCKFFS
jgi:hypothetical protein